MPTRDPAPAVVPFCSCGVSVGFSLGGVLASKRAFITTCTAGEASPALCGSAMRLPVHKVVAHVHLGIEFTRGQQQSALDVRIAH